MPSVCVGQLRERVPAHSDSVALLRDAAVGFARDHRATADQCDDIALAVSEAVTIGVAQAFVGHAAPGMIELRASRAQRTLVFVVGDRGNGLQTRLDSREIGMGLALIHRVTERLDITETEPGLLIKMTFALA